jgi:hypothetical protein
VFLRGGRREAEPEAAVVALEVDGEGVEVGGEDDAVVPAPVEGSGVCVNEDMLRHNPARYRWRIQICENKMFPEGMSRVAYSVYVSFKVEVVRCVTIRPTSGDAGAEK